MGEVLGSLWDDRLTGRLGTICLAHEEIQGLVPFMALCITVVLPHVHEEAQTLIVPLGNHVRMDMMKPHMHEETQRLDPLAALHEGTDGDIVGCTSASFRAAACT